MDNRKNILAVFSILFLVLAVAFLSMPRNALGQATIPTRTPKPEPTKDDDDGGGGGNKPNPTSEPAPTDEPTPEPLPPTAVPPPATAVPTLIIPTETLEPSPTVTPLSATETPFAVVPPGEEATPSVTVTVTAEYIDFGGEIVAFPENHQPFPEAGPCGLPPTFTADGATTIFAGPSAEYPLAGLIGETEVRPIVGRAAFTNWWIIQLDESGRAGWVSDELGTVHGYTGHVPIITAPDLYGVPPTPGGDIWAPTPAPCDAPELVVGAAVGEAAGSFDVVPPSGKPDSLDNLYDGVMVEQPSSAESTVEISGEETGTESTKAENLLADLAESAQPLELPSASTSTQQLPNLMPIAGFVLILAAVIVGLFARRGRPSSDASE